jgi:hypothetical protein
MDRRARAPNRGFAPAAPFFFVIPFENQAAYKRVFPRLGP